ncbi:hypothetical protein Pan14r_50310 [Crateriforma conspicua]|uniref:Uncharacterized protein n=1 Tax=Crateriforma conspicua TaxID=2527996 RepID=A0A5C5XQJ8_9PLAN|nr:hypothetical protein Pan14r_50310 [Crateriforma conspicua]
MDGFATVARPKEPEAVNPSMFLPSGSQRPKQTANELRAPLKGESAIVSAESRQNWARRSQ